MSKHLFVKVSISLLVFIAYVAQGVQATPAVFQSPPGPPPGNDDFNNATVIGALPFTATEDTTGATAASDDPTTCTNNGSVWFAFTPAVNMQIVANTFGSNYDTVLSVYTGSRGALNQVPGGCNDDFNGLQSQVQFSATSGTTYYFLIGFCCGFGANGGGNLMFSVQQIFPPPNDDFANAKVISSPPFNDTVDTSAASVQAGEPTPSCAVFYGPVNRTVWYAFTPGSTGSISAYIDNTFLSTVVAAYTGNSVAGLTEVGSRCFGGRLTFRANAGTTYYFQAAGLFGQGGSLQFHLEVAPPPVASFFFFPSDPSIFDTIQFFDQSFDPGDVGIQTQAWNFGDGATATGCCPTHRYAKDGDYTVKLTVTTFDGRTASTSQVVHVKTHDVAITKFSVPQSASSGQTRQIVVGVNSKRYLETVQVDLFKSVPNGYQFVGTLIQSVPVRSANRTTDFNFSYTFTRDDAIVGKVTFRAVATIIGARDALPADNEAISQPTKVNR